VGTHSIIHALLSFCMLCLHPVPGCRHLLHVQHIYCNSNGVPSCCSVTFQHVCPGGVEAEVLPPSCAGSLTWWCLRTMRPASLSGQEGHCHELCHAR
jgi:hypothetical protein